MSGQSSMGEIEIVDKLNIITRLSVIAGMVLISFSVFYYFVIFLPQKEQAKMGQQRQEQGEIERKERANRILLEACLSDAYKFYEKRWNASCKKLGIEEDCSLPLDLMRDYDDGHAKDREDCFKKYPQK